MSWPTHSPDSRLAQAVDAAERRLAMLERLAEMGMAVAAAVSEAVVEFPHRPGSGAEGARAFGMVSRAVRLTLILAGRVEKSILAIRKVELGLEAALAARDVADPPATRAERLRAAVTPALEREAADAEDAEMQRRRLNARLCERDDDHALLSRPFHDCVKAICADLGLDPEPILAMEDGGDLRETGGIPPHRVRRHDAQSPPPQPSSPGSCPGDPFNAGRESVRGDRDERGRPRGAAPGAATDDPALNGQPGLAPGCDVPGERARLYSD